MIKKKTNLIFMEIWYNILGWILILDILAMFILIGRTIWLGWTVYGIKLFVSTLVLVMLIIGAACLSKYIFSPDETKTKTPN